MNKRGHFFVFEGIDGSGKTTQIHLLQKRIEQQGVRCMETKISAMFAADRLDHLQNETDGLCHKIEEGISVISDRYVFSNYAYQSVSVPLEWLVQLNAQAAKLLRPDCHIFIDVDPTTAMERMAAGRFHTERYETSDRLTKVRDRYLSLFEQFQDTERILIVDGNRPVDTIANDIWTQVSALYS